MWWLIKNIILLPFLPFRIGWWLSKGTEITASATGFGTGLIPGPIIALAYAILIYWGVLWGIAHIAAKMKGG